MAIVGGGIVGMTTALLLSKETSLRIALFEQKPLLFQFKKEKYGERTSAISLASIKIFQQLSCFQSMVEKRIAPYLKMHVWDGQGKLDFDAKDVGVECLGYMIEDQVIQVALFEKLKMSTVDIFSPCELHAIHKKENGIELVYDENHVIQAKLLIGADGANSFVREKLHIPFKTINYDQTAIILHVKTELSHEKIASQRFLKDGPLAFLPLDDPHISSIVWSVKNSSVDTLLNISDDDFRKKLSGSFEYRLGNVTEMLGSRKSFPLRMRHVDHYILSHVALVGDAAHTLHPLAGQGVNLGLLDALTLATVVIEAHQKKREFFSFSTLRKYERARKSDVTLMITMVNLLNQLFSNDVKLLKELRGGGLRLINRLPWIKNFFVEYALGRHIIQ